jgi:hypothetical protein
MTIADQPPTHDMREADTILPARPSCQTDDGGFDHEWEFQDDSFDHEYGTERVHYWRCAHCDETRAMEAGDYDDEY